MRTRDVARDREAEAGPAVILIARVVESDERLEDFLAHARQNPRPIVVHCDRQPAVVAMAGERDGTRESRGIRHQIGEAALEGGRPDRDDRMTVKDDVGTMPVTLGIGPELVQEGGHVSGRRLLAGISTREPNHPSTGSLLRHSRSVVGLYLMHTTEKPELFAASLADLFQRVRAGQLRAVVGGVYPLSQAARAQEDLGARRTSGKVLLDPSA